MYLTSLANNISLNYLHSINKWNISTQPLCLPKLLCMYMSTKTKCLRQYIFSGYVLVSKVLISWHLKLTHRVFVCHPELPNSQVATQTRMRHLCGVPSWLNFRSMTPHPQICTLHLIMHHTNLGLTIYRCILSFITIPE